MLHIYHGPFNSISWGSRDLKGHTSLQIILLFSILLAEINCILIDTSEAKYLSYWDQNGQVPPLHHLIFLIIFYFFQSVNPQSWS